MSWRKWPEWLFGGLIADLVITLIGTVLSILYSDVYGLTNASSAAKAFSVLFFPMMFPSYLGINSLDHPFIFVVLGIAFTLVVYFIIGTVLGLIVKAVKRKKEEKPVSR